MFEDDPAPNEDDRQMFEAALLQDLQCAANVICATDYVSWKAVTLQKIRVSRPRHLDLGIINSDTFLPSMLTRHIMHR